MKIIEDRRAPNPRRVRIFLAEKGIEVPFEQIDIMKREHKLPEFRKLNPFARVPVLLLDDGTAIAETVAICRYFEASHPEPVLLGDTPAEQAIIEMWNRRMELNLFFPVAQVFRHSHPVMAELEVPQVGEWAEANRPRVTSALKLLDERLGESRFIAGEHYSIADITGLVAVDFMKPARIEVPENMTNLRRWHEEVSSRPSASA